MKIILLTSALSAGGAERVASSLANAWTARGDQVMLMPTFSGRGECFYELSQAVRLVYLADLVANKTKSLLNQLLRLYALRKFIASERPDVVISFLSNVNVAAVLATLGLKTPVIVCERIDPFEMPIPKPLRIACNLTYPFANILMVQTEAVVKKYKASGLKIPRMRVISNPVIEQILSIRYRPPVREKKCLLAVGRLAEQKQFDKLIAIFATIAHRYPNWDLRIIGDGALKASLQEQIITLGLEDRIELAGLRENIGEELENADGFVLTSSYEGFPNVLLEAMTVGLPCVTYDCPSGPRELSQDGEVALLVALNDEQAMSKALEKIMGDEQFRFELGRAARQSVIARFSLEKILQQWDSLFAEASTRN